MSAIVVVANAEGYDLMRVEVLTSYYYQRGTASQISIGSCAHGVGGEVAINGLLCYYLVINRQMVPRVSVSMVVMPFEATKITASLPRHGCSGSYLYRAIYPSARTPRQVIRHFCLESQVRVVGGKVCLNEVGVGELMRRPVRVDRTINNFRLGEFQGFMANYFRKERVAFLCNCRLFPIVIRRIDAEGDVNA